MVRVSCGLADILVRAGFGFVWGSFRAGKRLCSCGWLV